MCHIHVPAADHRLLLLQLQKIGKEIPLPFHAVFQPAKLGLGIGRVHGHQIKILHLGGDHTAFLVMLFYSKSVGHGQRLLLREYGGSGIAFAVGIVPVLMIARKFQLHLILLAFGLLQTENICVQLCKALLKALGDTCADSIYVP